MDYDSALRIQEAIRELGPMQRESILGLRSLLRELTLEDNIKICDAVDTDTYGIIPTLGLTYNVDDVSEAIVSLPFVIEISAQTVPFRGRHGSAPTYTIGVYCEALNISTPDIAPLAIGYELFLQLGHLADYLGMYLFFALQTLPAQLFGIPSNGGWFANGPGSSLSTADRRDVHSLMERLGYWREDNSALNGDPVFWYVPIGSRTFMRDATYL